MDLIRAGNAGRRGWAWAVLLTIVLALGVLSGCGKQGPDIDLADIDISEIDKIELKLERSMMQLGSLYDEQ